MKIRTAGLLALGLLAGCGTDPQDRVTGGAAAGAATGAGVGALGGPVGALAGAGIGGAAGAITGATTSPSEVNLGRPVWDNPEVRVPGTDTSRGGRSGSGRSSGVASNDTRALQDALNRNGFDVGTPDGVFGPRTRQAVMDWQRRNNMDATGRPNQQMLSALGVSGTGAATAQRTGRGTPTAQSDRDRAYMGGGTVGGSRGSTATGSGTGIGGASGGGAMGTGATATPSSERTGTTRPPSTGITDPGGIPSPNVGPNRSGGGVGDSGASSGGSN